MSGGHWGYLHYNIEDAANSRENIVSACTRLMGEIEETEKDEEDLGGSPRGKSGDDGEEDDGEDDGEEKDEAENDSEDSYYCGKCEEEHEKEDKPYNVHKRFAESSDKTEADGNDTSYYCTRCEEEHGEDDKLYTKHGKFKGKDDE